VAVIGADIKDELFPNLDPIGRILEVNGRPFRVIGSMPKEGKGLASPRSVGDRPLSSLPQEFLRPW